MNENTLKIISLCDGIRSCKEIAEIVGVGRRYVGKIARKYNLPQLHCGAQPGKDNHQYVSGRRIDRAGYVLVTAPENHPTARKRPNRNIWIIPEHRLVMEQKLGRNLLPNEVVDHKDGLTLHNDPNNLRIFQKNGDHLRETISGFQKHISVSGKKNIATKHLPDIDLKLVDTYGRRVKRGDVRLRQILLAALKFGIDSPYLLGTHRHLEKIGIDWTSHSNLEHALEELNERWAKDLLL
ncbi:MAG TPA: HNH endonuclease [Candidatus Wunengus sp. YC60]|uniref:HNH endonuclease n=1 Tax=Candidatus Wunengus sp. YC60 TaxID=3367697 RepID=UPI004024B96D